MKKRTVKIIWVISLLLIPLSFFGLCRIGFCEGIGGLFVYPVLGFFILHFILWTLVLHTAIKSKEDRIPFGSTYEKALLTIFAGLFGYALSKVLIGLVLYLIIGGMFNLMIDGMLMNPLENLLSVVVGLTSAYYTWRHFEKSRN